MLDELFETILRYICVL